MKKFAFALGLFFLTCSIHAQNGLESIIVEKYYISNVADSLAADVDAVNADPSLYPIGALPVGSVTYRIYADLLSGYDFQALYAELESYPSNAHDLKIQTTTSFYNNPYGSTNQPNTSKLSIKNKVVALDSWFSVGGVCNGNYGILKADDDGLLNNVTVASNSDAVLLNNVSTMGVLLTANDGMIAGSGIQPVTFVSTNGAEDAFGDGSIVANTFSITNASVASLSGSTGPTTDNRVLIAQITTDGILSFELNVQVGTPTGGLQKYVAKNPGIYYDAADVNHTNPIKEIQLPSLTYPQSTANIPPTVNITYPSNPSGFAAGQVVNIQASASDIDGTVASVEFFVDDVSIGVDAVSPYTATYKTPSLSTLNNHVIKAVATDDDDSTKTSTPVTINVGAATPDGAPEVSITVPADKDTLVLGDTITITVNATDTVGTDGAIVEVRFFVDDLFFGADADGAAPYFIHWQAALGTHTFKAQAKDNNINGGVQTTSPEITVVVVDTTNMAPAVSITAPASNAAFTAGDAVVIKADASDTDGTVVSVEFFVNNVKIGSASTSPYQFSWNSNVVGTAVALKAVATDDKGAKTTSAVVSISVAKAPNVLPVVSITSPKNGDVFALGNIVPIEASATDADGTIELVEFFVNGTLIGSDAVAPFKYNWTSSLGTAIALTVVATDYDGATDTSDVVTISVEEDADGINDINSSALSFNVYPSPTKGLLTIEFIALKPGNTNSYAIYDIKGNRIIRKELGKSSGKYTETMDISSFVKGQYIIELSVDGAVSSKQIIKN